MTRKLRRLLTTLSVVTCIGLGPGVAVITAAEEAPAARPSAAPAAAAPAAGPSITGLGVVKDVRGTLVTISGDAELPFEYSLLEGKNLVIDIAGAANKVWPAVQDIDDAFISRIQIGELFQPKKMVRVLFDLKAPGAFFVRGEGAKIVVAIGAPTGEISGGAAEFPKPPPASPGVIRVSDLSLKLMETQFRIEVHTNALPGYQLVDPEDQQNIAVLLPNARLESNAQKATDLSAMNAVVTKVTAFQVSGAPPAVKVVAALRQPTPFRVTRNASGLVIDVTPLATPAAVTPVGIAGIAGTTIPAGTPAPTATSIAAPGPVLPQSPPLPGETEKIFAGAKITLDFIEADVLDIFRLIAEVSGKNLIAGDEVKGRRSVKMTEIPWDQALELILKTNNPPLVQVPEAGNVIRITTLKRVLDERAEAEKKKLELLQLDASQKKQALENVEAVRKYEAEVQAQQVAKIKAERQRSKGWREKTLTISYGDTKEVAKRLEKFYSGCTDGCIFEVGERSSSIFVRDFADNVEQMTAVFEALEAPTPTILVEARIVEVQSDFSQSLGIQWGFSGTADQAHGNALPYQFPNSVAIAGTQSDTSGSNYLVNLPSSSPVAGVGLTLGNFANTFSLDLRLSALEKMGKTKILSNPKVLVIQNEDANINVGSQLPVTKTDSEGNRTVEWKDVGILLQVKPHVTSDGRVFMKVRIEKSAKGETVRTTEGDMYSIERRGAETKVLVGDGETSVIGGIFIQTTTGTDSGVPWFGKIPVLGWLFKARESSDNRKELMIFLTPKIVNRN